MHFEYSRMKYHASKSESREHKSSNFHFTHAISTFHNKHFARVCKFRLKRKRCSIFLPFISGIDSNKELHEKC